jgi:hypothetical protein
MFVQDGKPGMVVEKFKEIGKRLINDANLTVPPKQISVVCAIRFPAGPNTIIFDLMIFKPGCEHYNNDLSGRSIFCAYAVVSAVAVLGEKKKVANYNKVRIIDGLPVRFNLNVVPFAMEPTGRLRRNAFEFLFMICGTKIYRRSKFIKDVSLIRILRG